jgi:hypothetical protein
LNFASINKDLEAADLLRPSKLTILYASFGKEAAFGGAFLFLKIILVVVVKNNRIDRNQCDGMEISGQRS